MGEGENYGKIIGKIIEMILNRENDHNEIFNVLTSLARDKAVRVVTGGRSPDSITYSFI